MPSGSGPAQKQHWNKLAPVGEGISGSTGEGACHLTDSRISCSVPNGTSRPQLLHALSEIVDHHTVQDCPACRIDRDDGQRSTIGGSHGSVREHGPPLSSEGRIRDGSGDSREPDMVHLGDARGRSRHAVVSRGECAYDSPAIRPYTFDRALHARTIGRTVEGLAPPGFGATAVMRPCEVEVPPPHEGIGGRLRRSGGRHQARAGQTETGEAEPAGHAQEASPSVTACHRAISELHVTVDVRRRRRYRGR